MKVAIEGMGTDSKCPVCGKIFFRRFPAGDWAYKEYRGVNGKEIFYCSWHCLRAAEKKRGKKREGVDRDNV